MKKLITLFLTINLAVCMVSPVAFAYNPEHVAMFMQTQVCEACDLNLLNATPDTLGRLDYSDSVLTGSYFYGSSLEHLNLKNLRAQELNAVGLTLHDNDLTDADFSYGDISHLKVTHWNRGDRIKFVGSFLSGSDFSYTKFYDPDFSTAYLKNVSLYRIIWPRANLSNANLQSADLSFAKLQEANLEGTNLTGATLSHADLSYANLLNAKITADQLKTVLSVCGAVLPDGSLGICR